MRSRCAVWLVVALSWAVLSCNSGETHFARDPASALEIATMCDEWLGWRERCESNPNLVDPLGSYQECIDDPIWDVVWSRFVLHQQQCFHELECGVLDDECSSRWWMEAGLVPGEDELFEQCRAAIEACPDVIHPDACIGVLIYYDEPREIVSSCLSRSCEELGRCIDDPLSFR
jgi:hypothetical protein